LSCQLCPAGSYAPKLIESSYFDEWPSNFKTNCNLETEAGNPLQCDVFKGWFVNKNQLIDSSGSKGIPQGLKFSMKSFLNITSVYGGKIQITYRMSGF